MRRRHMPSRCTQRWLLLVLAGWTNLCAADEAIDTLPGVTVQGARDNVPTKRSLAADRRSPSSTNR